MGSQTRGSLSVNHWRKLARGLYTGTTRPSWLESATTWVAVDMASVSWPFLLQRLDLVRCELAAGRHEKFTARFSSPVFMEGLVHVALERTGELKVVHTQSLG